MGGYQDLKIWQLAVDLADEAFRLSEDWPKSELYGMTSQARRAAVSVAANIAEGKGRGGDKSFRHFLQIAAGSLAELETILIIAKRREFCSPEDSSQFAERTDELSRAIRGLLKTLDRSLGIRES